MTSNVDLQDGAGRSVDAERLGNSQDMGRSKCSNVPEAAEPSEVSKLRRQATQQLVVLLHSHRCQERREMLKNQVPPCRVPHCSTLMAVLDHIADCRDSNSCHIAHCASSKTLLRHYVECTNNKCALCLPTISKWQRATPFEERKHLVDLMLRTVSISPDIMVLGKIILDKISYAESAEKEMYRQARSRKEYYLLLSNKMWQIEMDIEEKLHQEEQDF